MIRDREQRGYEEEVADRVVGIVVDDYRCPAHDDGQTDSRLSSGAEIAQQEGSRDDGDVGAERRHDQSPVD